MVAALALALALAISHEFMMDVRHAFLALWIIVDVAAAASLVIAAVNGGTLRAWSATRAVAVHRVVGAAIVYYLVAAVTARAAAGRGGR